MTTFQRLPGLPAYGAPAVPFPTEWGRVGREGVVVEFSDAHGGTWVGNFAPGLGGATVVVAHPDGARVLVLAAGATWAVEPDARTAADLGLEADGVWAIAGSSDLVLSRQGLALARLGAAGIRWHTRRLAWDGFRDVRMAGPLLQGDAWDAVNDRWRAFSVDLATGRATGGAYDDADVEGWERLAPAAA